MGSRCSNMCVLFVISAWLLPVEVLMCLGLGFYTCCMVLVVVRISPRFIRHRIKITKANLTCTMLAGKTLVIVNGKGRE